MTRELAVRKLRHAADRLIPDVVDHYSNRVSLAFGYGTDESSSRVQAGVICQVLANEIEEELCNRL